MALHHDLLAQADLLAHADKKKPKQANLRRAVSAAYYAVFHLLVGESTTFLIAGKKREALRHQLARSFDHSTMKKAADAFVAPSPKGNAWRTVLGVAPSNALVDVASVFIMLQEARHEADYDLARVFSRVEVEALVAKADAAFKSWSAVAGQEEGDAFLVALLVRGRT